MIAGQSVKRIQKTAANLIISFLQEENITVEDFDEELNLNGFVHTLRSNSHSFL